MIEDDDDSIDKEYYNVVEVATDLKYTDKPQSVIFTKYLSRSIVSNQCN